MRKYIFSGKKGRVRRPRRNMRADALRKQRRLAGQPVQIGGSATFIAIAAEPVSAETTYDNPDHVQKNLPGSAFQAFGCSGVQRLQDKHVVDFVGPNA